MFLYLNQLFLWRRDVGQPDEDRNKQQQQQPANHSSDTTETARCLTPFSHPVVNKAVDLVVLLTFAIAEGSVHIIHFLDPIILLALF